MRHFTYEDRYGEVFEDCYFKVHRYILNDNLSVRLISESQGPILVVTTNTGDKLPDDMIAIKDYAENRGIGEWLYSLGIIEADPVKVIPAGNVQIPVFRLTKTGKEFLFENEEI